MALSFFEAWHIFIKVTLKGNISYKTPGGENHFKNSKQLVKTKFEGRQ